ncbi:Pimeloyl-ACP methyl ester carboxylesterase [Octadecabacter temperatus]|uniref:Carboxylesterase YbfK n=1 Tax=Octadecabacter temperatus TaxID=1458307 RepID=A0A0K0Y5H7_9RHOB|nr:alpha/beta fold hydrolase [Octadecabacter temperatus]AKS46141.1 Carboxylesterase YbfK [Octadecabacter temperatus]SIO08312.1 Pimeloyl-ACP methyl ester carboxylesterase [Octadecabacter temperatus]
MPTDTAAQIAWQEAGSTSNPTLIFLHAMAGSATAWAPQMDAFSSNFRCIAWDMPGFGDSADAPDGADMDWTVATLHRFVTQTLGLKSAHIVGLSVGGMILQHLAAAYPDLVDSAAILDSSPKFGYGGDSDPDAFADPILAGFDSGTTAAQFSDGMIRAIVGPNCSEDVKLATIKSMSRARINGLALTTRLIAHHDAVDKLGDITCPTLAMAGADDAETPPAYAYAIAQMITGASATIIPNSGHIVNLENPTPVTARLRFFLEHGL